MVDRLTFVTGKTGPQGPRGPKGDTGVGEPGPQGPEGPSGAAGGDPYVHIQSVPSASWVIAHNKHRHVDVTLLDESDTVVFADIQHGSLDTCTITLPNPMTGTAVVI